MKYGERKTKFLKLFTPDYEYELLKLVKPSNYNIRHKKCGTIFTPYYIDFMNGSRCPKCNENQKKTLMKKYGVDNVFKLKSIQEKSKKTMLERYGVDNITKLQTNIRYKKLIEEIKDKELKILCDENDYKGSFNHYNFECLKCGNVFSYSLNTTLLPTCRICNPLKPPPINKKSKVQKEMEQFISEHIEIVPDKYFTYDKKHIQLDIFVPSKLFGIELDSLYWHTEITGNKHKHYHLNKTKTFEKHGIKVIHIFDCEWYKRNDIVKSMLLNKLGLITDKIYARKCEIKEVDYKTSSNFLNANHLQGDGKGSIRIGLYFNDELVSLMTFSKPRFNKNHDWELIRYCNKINTSVVGGFSKLLKYFRDNHIGSIVTYADRRYSTGVVYEKNGFLKINETEPQYYYTNNYVDLENRMKYQKKLLIGEGTEWEIMQRNGYDRIYDCGVLVYAMF